MDDPPIHFAGLARSFGIYGEGPIEDPAKIRPALERAVHYIKESRTAALVDVVAKVR